MGKELSNPYKIEGPAQISFSGGRSSGYMLRRILAAHGGALPSDVVVTFANTGKERPETLDFVRDVGVRWDVPIVWLEFVAADKPADRFKVVTYETAARHGEPFADLIGHRRYLPNPVTRFCTLDLKISAMTRYTKSIGLAGCDHVIGIRADEPQRIARTRARNAAGKDGFEAVMPLVPSGVTKAQVAAFWRRQNFDLRLPNIKGTTPAGNCDLCFLKGLPNLMGALRAEPALADWWIEQEARGKREGWDVSDAGHFRFDRMRYAEMKRAVADQSNMDFGPDENLVDCFCGDGA